MHGTSLYAPTVMFNVGIRHMKIHFAIFVVLVTAIGCGDLKPKVVHLSGSVQGQGTHMFYRGQTATLLTLINRAGGIRTPDGQSQLIISRTSPETAKLSITIDISSGEFDSNVLARVALNDGDHVKVYPVPSVENQGESSQQDESTVPVKAAPSASSPVR
jgi:hypothetical protein